MNLTEELLMETIIENNSMNILTEELNLTEESKSIIEAQTLELILIESKLSDTLEFVSEGMRDILIENIDKAITMWTTAFIQSERNKFKKKAEYCDKKLLELNLIRRKFKAGSMGYLTSLRKTAILIVLINPFALKFWDSSKYNILAQASVTTGAIVAIGVFIFRLSAAFLALSVATIATLVTAFFGVLGISSSVSVFIIERTKQDFIDNRKQYQKQLNTVSQSIKKTEREIKKLTL